MRTLIPACLALAAGLACVPSTQASVLDTWNLMVFGNHQISSNVEGRVLVGGTLTGTGDIGTRLTPASSFLNTDVLLVGGSVSVGSIQLQAGNLRVAGSRTGNINFNGGGTQINDPSALATANAARTEVLGIAAFLAAQAPTTVVSLPQNQPAGVTIVAQPRQDGVAIVSIPASSLFSNSLVQSIDLNFNGATSVIFNITGAAVSINQANFVGTLADPASAARVLWNFTDATTINVQRQIVGAFIAPNASVTNTSTIIGTTAVNSLTQNGQVHIPLYTGYIPAPSALAALALGGIVASRRRR